MALRPRSEMAKLIDFVKFNGMVEGSRGSVKGEYRDRRSHDADIPRYETDKKGLSPDPGTL